MNNQLIATPKRTREILSKFNFSFQKSLGQNFIIDANILRRMIEKAGIHSKSGVIEIGPGIGALTELLAQSAKKVLAYEIDRRLIPILQEELGSFDHLHIIHEDILQADLQFAIAEYFNDVKDIHIVANLPYYITTPIVMKLLRDRLPIQTITIMIQKEVAGRMAASPQQKQYGSLSVAVQYYTFPETIMHVPANVFMPRPNVDSAVLKLSLREQPPVKVLDEDYFFSFVKACFAQRRKTLRNNLRSYFKKDLPQETLQDVLEKTKIDGQRRGETLTIEEFAYLANAFYRTQNLS